ncbi:hypothetical protein [Segniliparus rotundus]|nr:hypothetical protein [Segniliparus rotundus]
MTNVSQPSSQWQAQEVLYEYMRKTLQALPQGISLDNTRLSPGGGVDTCEDRIDSENSPISYYDYRDMRVPQGIDYAELVAKVGDVWRSWGWRVEERKGSDNPNRYGYSPDGYSLNITARPPQFASFPPSFGGNTPCFPPELRDDHVPIPPVITRDDS